MVSFKPLAAAALLVQAVLASPTLSTRAEGVHLFNCRPSSNGVAQTWQSLVVVRTYLPSTKTYTSVLTPPQYCANDSDCSNSGYNPSSDNVCVKSSSGTSGSYHIWEGGSQSCTFPTGVKFSWNITSNAQSQPNYSTVGYVDTAFLEATPWQLAELLGTGKKLTRDLPDTTGGDRMGTEVLLDTRTTTERAHRTTLIAARRSITTSRVAVGVRIQIVDLAYA